MDTSEEEFIEQFKFGLVEVVFEWANQMPFAEIMQLTDVQEGKRCTKNWPFALFSICRWDKFRKYVTF